ncbi:bifunctional riboflavin kinase/FAD synthetase [Hahella chejuensis]|nr:bifunctional riboflavin kinase/FAD synthetase [Hahella chejuensis]
MKLIRGLHNLKPFASGCVATIGNFDGVHIGHQVIISQLQSRAESMGVPAVVMVFEPQPREFFEKLDAPPRLMRFREKLDAIAALNVDYLLCLQFNRRLRGLTAQQFIDDVLVTGLHVKHLVVGDDFRFGCDRSGDFRLLEKSGLVSGFSVENTPTVEVEGERVSSTRIRATLAQGEFTQAEDLLGRPYSITGCVVHGRKLGRQLNAPTANVSLGRKRPVLSGVYLVKTTLATGHVRFGVANIGVRPTIDGLGVTPALEVHLFEHADDIYGQRINVQFLEKLRDERKFSGLEQLQAQIQRDIEGAKRRLQSMPLHSVSGAG